MALNLKALDAEVLEFVGEAGGPAASVVLEDAAAEAFDSGFFRKGGIF